jgi:hypothetical protein
MASVAFLIDGSWLHAGKEMNTVIAPHSKSTMSTGEQMSDFIGAWVHNKSYNSSAPVKNDVKASMLNSREANDSRTLNLYSPFGDPQAARQNRFKSKL